MTDYVAEVGPSRKQARQSESWRTQVYFACGPRRVNTSRSEPQINGLH